MFFSQSYPFSYAFTFLYPHVLSTLHSSESSLCRCIDFFGPRPVFLIGVNYDCIQRFSCFRASQHLFPYCSVIKFETSNILDNLFHYALLLKCVLKSLFWRLDLFSSECLLCQLQYNISCPMTSSDFWFRNTVTVLLESKHQTDLNV